MEFISTSGSDIRPPKLMVGTCFINLKSISQVMKEEVGRKDAEEEEEKVRIVIEEINKYA